MDRITRRIGTAIDFVDGKGYANLPHEEGVRLLFESLAEYEDIGLTPDEIKTFFSDFGFKITMENRELKKELQENEKIISKMAKRLKAFEENIFNIGWISVNERFPDKYCEDGILYNHQRVIATLKNGCVLEMWWGGANENFRLLEGMSLIELTENPVVAWMPMPEPYEELL